MTAVIEHLNHHLRIARPELVVTTLLRHSLAATRHALVAVHPEIELVGDIGEVDDDGHLALLIAIHLAELDKLLAEYRHAVERHWWAFEEEIPF